MDAQEYTAQFSQKGADMCHPCFLEVCKTGFKPVWKTRKLNDETGKWDEVEEE